MKSIDLILISQSEVVNYSKYSRFPLDRIELYSHLVYPRMVHFEGQFRSHLDLINLMQDGIAWEDATYEQRRQLLSIWNLPSFNGVHLSNYLQQSGFNTYIINNFDAEFDILCDVYEGNDTPPLVGISTTFYLNYSEISRLISLLKETYPDMEVVIGGAFANGLMQTDNPTQIEKVMRKYHIDYLIHSFNSEVDLRDLLLARDGKKEKDEVANLAFFDERDNLQMTLPLWHNPILDQAPLKNINLPRPYSIMQTRTASGCPFSCAFCSYPELANGSYLMSLDVVEENLKQITSLPHIRNIIFLDDTFNVPPTRFKELCKLFARYDFEWYSFLRVQYVDDETALLMKDSGCRGVYLGVESASDQVLKNMNKRATRADFLRGMEHLKKYDITAFVAFVLGFPGETESTIQENIDFIERYDVEFYSLKEFFYMENTPVHLQRDQYGLTGMGNVWSHDTMDSQTASEIKQQIFAEVNSSVFIDPDTSLWYLAYLNDQGFSMNEVREIQKEINSIMTDQMKGHFSDTHPGFERLRKHLLKSKNKVI